MGGFNLGTVRGEVGAAGAYSRCKFENPVDVSSPGFLP